MLFTVRSNFII